MGNCFGIGRERAEVRDLRREVHDLRAKCEELEAAVEDLKADTIVNGGGGEYMKMANAIIDWKRATGDGCPNIKKIQT